MSRIFDARNDKKSECRDNVIASLRELAWRPLTKCLPGLVPGFLLYINFTLKIRRRINDNPVFYICTK
jgi:hypothetical protein